MSASNKRPVVGSRSPARPNTSADAARRMRMGLLGSTALIAASLAVSPAFAQIATPAGGGTITRAGGSSNTTDNTGAGGGVLISNVTQAAVISVNGVTINNTTGAPAADALRILGETSTLNSTGVTLTGVNTLTTTVNGGSALYVQTGANMGVGITSSGSTFTGSYGINLQAPGGYVDFSASGQSQSFVANGTHIAGFNAVTGVNAAIRLGSSTFTGFDTGINSSNFYGSFVEMTGGSINALVTGIRTDATGGANNIQSQAAIVAQTGIHSTNTDTNGVAANLVTSGGGTIDSTSNGLGTGILTSNSGGSNNLNVTVGAAIGGTTRFATGVNASTTGTTTGIVNVATTAAISATGTAINMTAVAGATANVQGAIIAGTGIASATTGGVTNITTSGGGTLDAATAGVGAGINATTSGSGAINVTVGAAIGGTTAFADGVVITTTNPSTAVINFHNTAAITASTASSTNSGLEITMWTPPGRSTIDVEANITGGRGVFTTGGVYDFFVRDGVTVTAAAVNGDGINSSHSGSTLNNAGVIRATGAGGYGADIAGIGSITNSGTIEGAARGISLLNSTTINNTGTIAGGTGGGIQGAGAVINNTGGTISGNWGIFGTHNNNAITNSAGGVITGVVDAINLSSTAFGFLNNSGTISTGGGASSAAGIYQNRTLATTYTITNTGTITGGADATYGYAVSVDDGGTTINNNSGGQLNSLTGLASGNAIRLNADDSATLNLNLGSTVNGRILSSNSGARAIVLGGSVTGGYDGSGGTGVDTFTLASTGSIGGAVLLGGGDDTFTYQGGTFTTINAGAGTADAFVTNFSSGSGSVDMANLSAFESHTHQSGTLTLTGNNTGAYGWVGSAGTTITLDGTLDGISNSSFGISMFNNVGSTVNILAGSVLGGVQSGVQFNGGAIGTMTNAGTISVAGSGVSSVSGRVNLTNSAGGSISSSLFSGVFLATGGGTILNDGLLSGGSDASFGYGLRSVNNASVGNSAAITNNATRTITGGTGGIAMAGAGTMTVVNAGTISGTDAGSSGVRQTTGTVTITNNSGGSLIGNGYGVNVDGSGILGLTNASGGAITGSTAAVRADTTGAATIDLQVGSATNGSMILSGSGARTVNVAGGFFGNLDATGNSGAVNLTLNTSATGYVLLHAGSGADSLTFNGSGSRSFSVDNLSGWETGSFTGGSWTLTGTGNQNSFTSGVTINGAALTVSNTQQFQGATGLTLTGNGSITTTASLSNTRTLAMTGAGSLGAASGQTLTQSGVVSGAGVLTVNGPGTIALSGNNTYTGGTVVNAGILQLGHTSAAGTGLIRMIDPQINFAATGTYNNNISLEVVDGQQAADPTLLNNTSGGAITLAGQIYETAGVGGAGQYVTFNGGSITLTNGANSWGGVTRINSGATVLGTNASISGGSIVNNGTLTYQNVSAGTASQNISGAGAININGTGLTLAGAITTSGQLTISGAGSNLILAGSRSGASNTGAVLSATGGSLTIADGASLQSGQYNGVRITSANATVTNLGLLQNAGTGGDGTVGAGIYVLNGGAGGTTTVNNGSLTDTGVGSTIQGRNAGVRHESGSTDLLVVNNYGLIVGDLYNGVENTAGGLTVNNFAGGYITAVLGNGVSSASSSAVSITNAGTIGRNIAGTVTVGGYGVTTNGALTLVNQSGGLITGTLGGLQSSAAGSSITNQAGGTILGNLGVTSWGGTLNNAGLIRGLNNDAVILNAATALTNSAGGLIVGAGNEGVFINANGSTINNAGLIVNSASGIGANFSVAIANSGVIASGAAPDAATTSAHISRGTGTAVALGAGGSVTNLAGGEILGGVGVSFNNGAGGTLTNAGLIDGSTLYGVQMSGAGTITNQSGGVIGGAVGSIRLTGSGAQTIDLAAGSNTNGLILATGDGTHTINIAGALAGSYEVLGGLGVDNLTLASTGSMTSADLGFGADSFTYQGGNFSGLINAGTETDSFVSALGAGSASVDLNNITNFETFTHQSGTLTLTGTGAFSNGSTVTGGALIVDGVLQSDVAVATGGALSGGGTITGLVSIADGASLNGAQGSTLTMGNLLLGANSEINATFSSVGGTALFDVVGDLVLNGTVNVASTGAYGFGVYGLMTYGGLLTNNELLIGTTPAGAQRMSVQTSVAGQINIVHAPNELLFWDGGNGADHDNGAVNGGSGTWTAAGSNWTDAGGLFNGAMNPQPGFAIFQAPGGTVTVDDSLGAVGVTGMQFAADGYRIEGDSITLADPSTVIRVGDGTAPSAAWTTTIASVLTGAGGLVKTDLGTLILAGENDYTGGTTVNAGTLQVGDGATAGSIAGSAALANNSTLVFSRNDNHDFTNDVSGAGSVGVNGAVTLSGAITASGGVDVYSFGEVIVSNVNVASGSAVYLAGNTLVTVAAGGSVISQNGSGVESVGSSIYNYGSIQGTAQGVLATAGSSVWNFDSASVISGVTGINNTSAVFGLGVYNAGTITGSLTAVYSAGGVSLNNDTTGTISGQFAISALGNLNMANAGTISASVTNFNNSGIYTAGTGTISNTGTITSGTNAIYTQGAGTVTNSGLIQGGGNASTIRLFGANSSVDNLAAGQIATTGTGVGVFLDGINGSVTNAGSISGGNAVYLVSGGTIDNSGSLTGTVGSAVVLTAGGTITNQAAGSISGASNGVNVVGGSANISNAGTISGTSGQGVLLNAGGTVTNTGSITGGQSGVHSLAALNLISSGTISGTTNAVESVGTFNDSLTFLAGSTTTGAVLTAAGDDLVSLAGTLNGALNAGDGADTVTLFDTASFTSLDGADGVDAFVLDGTGGSSLDIGQVLNFESRAKNGAGAWVLTGTDASTTAWAVNAGVLAASGGSSINDAAFVNIGAGGTLALLNDETIGALTGTGFVDLGAGRLTLVGAETTTYDGVISGSGGLTIGSAYGLTLTGANTYDGATVVDGVLRLGASGVLADTSSLLINTGGVVELQGFDETVDNAFISGVLNGPGALTASVYALDGGSVQANLGTGLLVNVGGTSTLSGTSDASLVLVDGGTLTLGASDRIVDTADLQVSTGAAFDLGAYDETVNTTWIEGTLAGTGTLTALQHQLNGATINGNLAGGSVYVMGGASTLNGLSDVALLSVLSGSLTLGGSDRIVDTAILAVSSGAVLDIDAFNESVDLAVLDGTLNGTGTLTANEYDLNGATVNANLGAGDLYNTGGVSTLNGTSNADLVIVQAGTLTLGASDRLSDTAGLFVTSGSTFDIGAFNDTIELAVLEGTLAGTGTLTAADYLLFDGTVNANLGTGNLYSLGASTLNGVSGAELVSVQDGTLTLGASDRLSDAALLVVTDGALNLGAFNETVEFALLNGVLDGTGTLTATEYVLDDGTVNANLGAGVLYSEGSSTLNGTAGAGEVFVDDGVLTLGAANRLADTAVVTVSNGAALNLGAFNDTVAAVLLNGTLAGTGTLTANEYDLNGATVNANLGAGNLFNTGGVSTLNGMSGSANVLVQAGTLALGASNRLADNATVSVTAGSTLNLNAFNDTVGLALLNGTLAGTGTLTAAQYQLNAATVNANLGAGTLFNVSGVSTLNGLSGAGVVSVQAGTLALGASNRLADNATVTVAAGSTLNLNAFNDTVGLAAINGALAGTGTLTAAQYQLNAATVNANLGAGALFNLGGVSTLNGTAGASQVSINAGTLRLGANERLSDAAVVSVASGATFNVNGFNERVGALFGTGDVNVSAGRLTFGGVESGFGGRLSGTGQLVHTGGLFTLTGNHTIASISNTGGELRFAGTTTGGISASGGSVTGAGTIGGALTASNGAILSPGLAGVQNGIGGFTAGGLTLNGGALAIDVRGTSGGNQIDQLQINGTATLTGGLLAPTFQGTAADFNFSTRYLFLQANNLVGTFANGGTFTAAAQEGLFWRVRYDLSPNAAVLELRELTNFDPGATGTGNQRSVGQALSGGQLSASDDWAAILSLIAGLNAADRAAAFDSISGEPLADVTTSMFNANDTFLTAMRDGGMGGRNDGGEALNFVGSMSFGGGRENSADRLGDVLGAFDPSASTARGAGGWVSAWSGDQTLDGKPGQATVESSLNGFAGGYGIRNGSLSIGGAGGVTRLEGDVVARQGHYESDLSHAAGYVAFDDGVWAADVSASFYGGDLDTRRGITVGAFTGQAIGNTHVEGQALSASVARRFQVTDTTMIALGAIGTASNASVDGYTETGAGGLSLQASGQERDWQSLQLTARATQDYRVNGHGFRIYGGAGVMAIAGDRQATGDMRFTGAPIGFGTFTVEGAEAPPMAGLVDFGVEVGAGEGVTVSAGYRGLFSERLEDNQIGIKLNVSW